MLYSDKTVSFPPPPPHRINRKCYCVHINDNSVNKIACKKARFYDDECKHLCLMKMSLSENIATMVLFLSLSC